MNDHLVFRHHPITCHFRKIHTLGSTEPAGIVGGELFGSVTVKVIMSSNRSQIIVKTGCLYLNYHQGMHEIDLL